MTASPPRARPGTPRDLDRLSEMYLALGRAYSAADPQYGLAIDAGRMWREHIDEGLKSDRIRVVVTEDESRRAVSFLVARVAPSPPGAASPSSGLIEGAYVEPAFRRQGRLKAMLADAMRWFSVKRVASVDLIADLRDEAARAAWHALGFADVQSVMRAKVPPAD
jgi:predicted GNAT family acetyltransferase